MTVVVDDVVVAQNDVKRGSSSTTNDAPSMTSSSSESITSVGSSDQGMANNGATTEDYGLECGCLASIIDRYDIFLGGSSMGKGFRRAARHYLRKVAPSKIESRTLHHTTHKLNGGVEYRVEDPFYVVDIGMVVSQYYQWKQLFKRVEPFYAVKCNPDPVILQTLAKLGCNFDCASRNEMRLVHEVCQRNTPVSTPDIIYANPTKSRSHVIEAVACHNVTLMTFDNVDEVIKLASISKHVQLVLRIITDDSGSQCRLSSKYGAPKSRWHSLLQTAKDYQMQVVGVSFHVGSGCRDASRYELALRDARELFDLAQEQYGFDMTLLDIGGGFPGETHSLWNPAEYFGDPEIHVRKYSIDGEIDLKNDTVDQDEETDKNGPEQTMYFREIADAVVPWLDELFPPSSGVRIIGEPGRYFVAASATLCASIVGVRTNATSDGVRLAMVPDGEAAKMVDQITRAEEDDIVADQANKPASAMIDSIVDELGDYAQRFARLNLTQQEFDVYVEDADFTEGHVKENVPLLAPPTERLPEGEKVVPHHTVEGMSMGIVADCFGEDMSQVSEQQSLGGSALDSGAALTAAGEAAVSGVVMHAIAETTVHQDEYAYYINDGVYGAFNNLVFDHALVRPRHLKDAIGKSHRIMKKKVNGSTRMEAIEDTMEGEKTQDKVLYPCTVFGPTCDSMDVISRSVLLPRLAVGDWLYFSNMGAYTSAAASDFNGFTPTDMFYVCSVQPEHFEQMSFH